MDLHAIATELRDAVKHKKAISPISDRYPEITIEDAYQIQLNNTRHWMDQGRRKVGYKIGLTSPQVQQQLGVNQPDFGILYADMSYGSGASIDLSGLLFPKAEAEIALVLKADLSSKDLHITELMSAIDYVLPAIEIVDSRIDQWKIKITDTIADNASSGLFVLGTKPVSPHEVDFELCGMRLDKNGEVASTGVGSACMGNPLLAALWLAREMAARHMPLASGDVILTGALGPMIPIAAGDYLQASIHGLGDLHCKF